MFERDDIINHINSFLLVSETKDYCQNGLQVEGTQKVKKIAFGVSASLELFKKAAEQKANMVIVHHGLIWNKPFVITGYKKERIKILIENDISLAGYHLPLDRHNEVGNNIGIIKWFNPSIIIPFSKDSLGNKSIGFIGILDEAISFEAICKTLESNTGKITLRIPPKTKNIKKIAVVSGGAADCIYDAIDAEADVYITGEPGEYIQQLCQETGIGFIAGGHYNTEKTGILALQKYMEQKFNGIETVFIDIPNPA